MFALDDIVGRVRKGDGFRMFGTHIVGSIFEEICHAYIDQIDGSSGQSEATESRRLFS